MSITKIKKAAWHWLFHFLFTSATGFFILIDNKAFKGLNLIISAGMKIRSAINAMMDAEAINTPREKTWVKEEKRSPREEKKRTAVVETRAREVISNALVRHS